MHILSTPSFFNKQEVYLFFFFLFEKIVVSAIRNGCLKDYSACVSIVLLSFLHFPDSDILLSEALFFATQVRFFRQEISRGIIFLPPKSARLW